jgi:flagellar hook-associated protein 1 FlgK
MLRSTFAGFNMAQLALSVNQKAIDVAGQNISNVNTTGYTRQRLDQSSITPVGLSASTSVFDNKVGQGVMVKSITQIRNSFLDVQYRNQMAKVGTVDVTDSILSKIGTIFDETETEGVRTALNDLVAQLTNMASPDSAGDSTSNVIVRSSASVLLNILHQKATDLNQVESDLLDLVEDTYIENVNTILSRVAELNQAIKNNQVLGNPCLELQDERNLLLDDLSSYLPISVTYKDDNTLGATVDVLEVTFTRYAADGTAYVQTLVSDGVAGSLSLGNQGKTPVSILIKDAAVTTNANGDYDKYNNVDIVDSLQNGVLKGACDMLNKEEVFDGSDFKGIGYYRNLFDEFVNTFATTLNQLNALKNDDGTIKEARDLFETSDGTTTFTAANIKISEKWMSGDIELTRSEGDGTTAYDNIQRMINALTTDSIKITYSYPDPKDPTKNITGTVYNGTLMGAYNSIQNTQAIERSASSVLLSTHTTVLNQIADSIDSTSGVSLDEEVIDLMRYSQSYNAAAKLMTTLDELLDVLINHTGA